MRDGVKTDSSGMSTECSGSGLGLSFSGEIKVFGALAGVVPGVFFGLPDGLATGLPVVLVEGFGLASKFSVPIDSVVPVAQTPHLFTDLQERLLILFRIQDLQCLILI